MKTISIPVRIMILALVSISALFVSFALRPGTDHFQVYVNNKLVMEEFTYNRKTASPIVLDGNTGLVGVLYSHCGVMGTARKLSLKDGSNNVIKMWEFADVNPKAKDVMKFDLAELNGFRKSHQKLSLCYHAKELVEDVVIAPIQWEKNAVAGKDTE